MRCALQTVLRLVVARVALRGQMVPATALLQDEGNDRMLTTPSSDSDSADGEGPRLPVSGTGGRGDDDPAPIRWGDMPTAQPPRREQRRNER